MNPSSHYGEKWERDIPEFEWQFGDRSRWLRAERLGFGEGSSIYLSAYVFNPENVKVGKGTWIGPNVLLDGSGGLLEIGEWCSISAGVQIYTHDSVKWALSSGVSPYSKAPTKIGNRCYLAPYVVVAKGSIIPDGSIIPAHSLVKKEGRQKT